MLIHLTPQIYAGPEMGRRVNPALLDFVIPELGIAFTNGSEITLRKPYPNKDYFVVCRNKGQKAIKGILIETDRHIQEFTAITRWDAGDSIGVVTHEVQHIILDSERGAVSSCPVALEGTTWNLSKTWDNRCAAPAPGTGYFSHTVCMSLTPTDDKVGDYIDTFCRLTRALTHRKEVVRLHTIEPERIFTCTLHPDRIPAPNDAFQAKVTEVTA